MKKSDEFYDEEYERPRRTLNPLVVKFNAIARENRNQTIAETQLERIKKEEKVLFFLLNQYLLHKQLKPRNYDYILMLEKRIDLIAEDYAKSKIYILCK